jgi:hypothetical protein
MMQVTEQIIEGLLKNSEVADVVAESRTIHQQAAPTEQKTN